MTINTIIELPDKRIGTICYNNLDGYGGVWGRHHFSRPEGGFGDELPDPEFMLRPKRLKGKVGINNSECVGEKYKVIEE